MAELINKQGIKNKLSGDLSDEVKKIKDVIANNYHDDTEQKDKWNEFEEDLINYALAPTVDKKQALDKFIEVKLNDDYDAKKALSDILKELGVQTKSSNKSEKNSKSIVEEAELREKYAKYGLRYIGDIIDELDKEFKSLDDEKYGIVREGRATFYKTLLNSEKAPTKELVENGKFIEPTEKKLDLLINGLESRQSAIKLDDLLNNEKNDAFELIEGFSIGELKVCVKALSDKENSLPLSENSIESYEQKLNKSLESIGVFKNDSEETVSLKGLTEEQLKNLVAYIEDIENPDKALEHGSEEETFINKLKKLNGVEELSDEDKSKIKLYVSTKKVLEALEIEHKLMITRDIREQLENIKQRIQEYDDKEKQSGELSRKEGKNREELRKIAAKKIKYLEKAKLTSIVGNGEKTAGEVMEKAGGILLPKLEDSRDYKTMQTENLLEEQG